MTNDLNKPSEQYIVHSPAEVAKLLNVETTTLRKYAQLLEKYGYEIERNNQGHRYYHDKDIMTIRKVISGRKGDVSLEESVRNVIILGANTTSPHDTNTVEIAHKSDIVELKDMINKQNELIKGLTDQLNKQQKYFDESLKERDQALMHAMDELATSKEQLALEDKAEDGSLKDRDKVLMQTLDEMLEVRKQLSTIKENESLKEEEEREVKKKKGFFAKLFGGN